MIPQWSHLHTDVRWLQLARQQKQKSSFFQSFKKRTTNLICDTMTLSSGAGLLQLNRTSSNERAPVFAEVVLRWPQSSFKIKVACLSWIQWMFNTHFTLINDIKLNHLDTGRDTRTVYIQDNIKLFKVDINSCTCKICFTWYRQSEWM